MLVRQLKRLKSPPQTDPGPPTEGTSRSQATAPNDSPPTKKHKRRRS